MKHNLFTQYLGISTYTATRVATIVVFTLMTLATTVAQAQGIDPAPAQVKHLAESVRAEYAPDSRTAIFDARYTFAERKVTLGGMTTSPEARQAMSEGLKRLGYDVTDTMLTLPDSSDLGEKIYAIVNLSVCNIRSEADFSSEMVTQALMGMPLKVLRHDGWYLVQTPDNYIAWVNGAALCRVDAATMHAWNTAEQVVVTSHYGFVYSEPDTSSQTLSDIVAGDRLQLLGTKGKFYRVAYPDGRIGFILKTQAAPVAKWRKSLRQDADAIISTARTLMGIPYLWAGTSSKGVDCSGFVRTVLFMHDIIIPRDASQQALTGERIEIADDFGNLQRGDLILFGRKATADRGERVIHVGIYMGDRRFIHSQGSVRISSFDAADPLYDEYNLGRLLFAVRILPYINRQPLLNTTLTNPYYNF